MTLKFLTFTTFDEILLEINQNVNQVLLFTGNQIFFLNSFFFDNVLSFQEICSCIS
jgi:hypothetical protein